MYGLTTAHGTLLCLDRESSTVVQRRLQDADPADLLLLAEIGNSEFGVVEPDGSWRVVDPLAGAASKATFPARPQVAVIDGLAQFAYPGGFLRATDAGAVALAKADAREWETFGLFDPETLGDLIMLARSDWLRLGHRMRIGRHAIGLSGQRMLRVGNRAYPIAGNFPLTPEASVSGRIVLCREGWKLDSFRRFRPLIYFVLMGDNAYHEQFRLATESLDRFGLYDGDVLVVTDRPFEVIEELISPGLLARTQLLPATGGSKVDAVLARLMLPEFANAAEYGPVLYSDTDVMFDRPVMPILEQALALGRMSAQRETWNELPHAPHSGAELFQADPVDLVDPYGFNAGVWSMPGGRETIEALNLMRRGLTAYLDRNGRDSLPWLDQAMSNYALRKLEFLDASLMTETVRLCQAGYPISPEGAAGFVHFWPVSHSPHERAASMAAYLVELDAHSAPRGIAAD